MPSEKAAALLMLVLDEPPDERENFLLRQTPSDPQLRAEVRKLLKAHEQAGDFLERGVSATEVRRLLSRQPPEPLSPGTELGDFLIERKIGEGGFGAVYLAKQISLSRTVALKVTRDEGSEGQVLAALEHDHIVKVFSQSFDRERRLKILCMPYVPGRNLREILRETKGRPLDGAAMLESAAGMGTDAGSVTGAASAERERTRRLDAQELALWMGAVLADALSYAHSRGVLHLDIKPENILVTPFGRPMLVDFNVAWRAQAGAVDAEALRGGTPDYMAPEQEAFLRGGAVQPGPAADIYSLGAVLRELSGPARKGPALTALIECCLAADPARRFPSAAALAEALRHALERSAFEKAGARRRQGTQLRARLVSTTMAMLGLLPALWGAGLVAGLFPSLTPFRDTASGVLGRNGVNALYSLFFCVTILGVALVGRLVLARAVRRAADSPRVAGARRALLHLPELCQLLAWGGTSAVLYQCFHVFAIGGLPIAPRLFILYSMFSAFGNALFAGAFVVLGERLVASHWYPTLLQREESGDHRALARAELSAAARRWRALFGFTVAASLLTGGLAFFRLVPAPQAMCFLQGAAIAVVAVLAEFQRRDLPL